VDVLAGELFFHLSDFLPQVFSRVNGENYMGCPEFRSDRAGSGLWINGEPSAGLRCNQS
jgi:hypothetical protein